MNATNRERDYQFDIYMLCVIMAGGQFFGTRPLYCTTIFHFTIMIKRRASIMQMMIFIILCFMYIVHVRDDLQ